MGRYGPHRQRPHLPRSAHPGRQDVGVTQEELATRLDLSLAQVKKFEIGHKQIDIVMPNAWHHSRGITFLDFMPRLDREITAQLPDADAGSEGGAK